MSRRKRDRTDDIQVLEAFLDRARRIERSTIVQREVGSKLDISWERGSPTRWRSTEPKDELLRALLVDLRPMFLPSERTYLYSVQSICDRRLTIDSLRAHVRQIRGEWSTAQRQGILGLRINERDLSPEHVMHLWINGYYFHDDQALAAELRSLAVNEQMLTRHLFLDYVYRAVECTLGTAAVIKEAISRNQLES